MARPTMAEIFMRLARDVSRRATCQQPDRQVGCVIVDADMLHVLGIGYNGREPGGPNDACLEGPPGASRCACAHAEMNAISKLRSSPAGGNVFVTLGPCLTCAVLLANLRVSTVYIDRYYRDARGLLLLQRQGVKVMRTARHPSMGRHFFKPVEVEDTGEKL